MPKATKAVESPLIPGRVRNYAYPVITAALPLLAAWGIIGETDIPLYAALGAALLGVTAATAYRPRRTVEPLQAEVSVAKGAAEAAHRK